MASILGKRTRIADYSSEPRVTVTQETLMISYNRIETNLQRIGNLQVKTQNQIEEINTRIKCIEKLLSDLIPKPFPEPCSYIS